MPILSFSSNDIDVITGKKTRTIRKAWKTPLKVGDRLYCYWNLVSKEKMKIFEAFVTGIETVPFSEIRDNDELAVEEGFKNSKDMLKEFKKMYGGRIDPNDEFQIIYFEKIDIDDWRGDKIDEKAMITKRADILFDSGKFDKSTMCYEAALRLDPHDVYLLNKQGEEYEPANIYILNNKAIALLNSGNINEALKVSNIAYNYRPSSPIVLYWRGFILEMLGRYDDALRVYDKLIVIDGENPEVWNSRGNLLSDMGMLEEAIESFDKAVEVCLDDSEVDAAAINRMGNAYIDLGKFDEALECFNRAIDLEKNNIDFLLNKGVVLMELGKFEEAVDSFNKVLLRSPDNEDAFFLKEECLEYF